MIINIILCVLILLLFFILSLLFIPIDAGIEYILKDGISRMYLKIVYLKLFKLNIQIKTDKEEKQHTKKKLDATNYLDFIKKIKEAYCITKDEIKNVFTKASEEITFNEVLFDVVFDTGNAAKTGIMTGAVWTGSTFLIKIIDEIFGVNKVNVNVTPYFSSKCFNIHVKSILRLKLVNIIIIVVKILKIINIFKEKINKNEEKR